MQWNLIFFQSPSWSGQSQITDKGDDVLAPDGPRDQSAVPGCYSQHITWKGEDKAQKMQKNSNRGRERELEQEVLQQLSFIIQCCVPNMHIYSAFVLLAFSLCPLRSSSSRHVIISCALLGFRILLRQRHESDLCNYAATILAAASESWPCSSLVGFLKGHFPHSFPE